MRSCTSVRNAPFLLKRIPWIDLPYSLVKKCFSWSGAALPKPDSEYRSTRKSISPSLARISTSPVSSATKKDGGAYLKCTYANFHHFRRRFYTLQRETNSKHIRDCSKDSLVRRPYPLHVQRLRLGLSSNHELKKFWSLTSVYGDLWLFLHNEIRIPKHKTRSRRPVQIGNHNRLRQREWGYRL